MLPSHRTGNGQQKQELPPLTGPVFSMYNKNKDKAASADVQQQHVQPGEVPTCRQPSIGYEVTLPSTINRQERQPSHSSFHKRYMPNSFQQQLHGGVQYQMMKQQQQQLQHLFLPHRHMQHQHQHQQNHMATVREGQLMSANFDRVQYSVDSYSSRHPHPPLDANNVKMIKTETHQESQKQRQAPLSSVTRKESLSPQTMSMFSLDGTMTFPMPNGPFVANQGNPLHLGTSELERMHLSSLPSATTRHTNANNLIDSMIRKSGRKDGLSGKKDAKWLEHFEQLKLYRINQGDTLVPRGYPPNPRLASWVAEQRKQYKLLQDGRQSSISDSRVELLNSLGFAWNAQEAAWDRHIQDLKSFNAQHGHSHVPLNDCSYPKLGLWCKEQRRHYALMKQGKPSHMTEERCKSLGDLGFCWDTHEASWQERLRQLAEYKRKHGDCLVPAGYGANPKLSTWIHHQRRQYKKFMDGQPSHINSVRIHLLESMGFCWNARDRNEEVSRHPEDQTDARSKSLKAELGSASSVHQKKDYMEDDGGGLPRKRRKTDL